MPDIALRFHKDVLVCEGAMGTMLMKQGLPAGECGEFLNVLDPELVLEVHRYYQLAGADCAISNSFGGSRHKLDAYGLGDRVAELNMAAVKLARKHRPQHVLADVGPCGLVMEPLGSASYEEVFAQYFEQISALAKAEPDAILIETMVDIADARCALLAAKAACDLPVFVSCSFDQSGRMDLSGTDPATAARILEACGADVVGINCALGPEQSFPLLQQMAAATSLPLLAQPNAGMPQVDAHGVTRYPGSPEQMADWSLKFRSIGVQFIGSCCGSTPAFTAAIKASLDRLPVVPRQFHGDKTYLCGPRSSVLIDSAQGCKLVGERINPTGKKAFAAELAQGSLSMLRDFAAAQLQKGADLLDVNVGAAGVYEPVMLRKAVSALVGAYGCPLSIDSADPEALEQALKLYPGRALINSCNGSEDSYRRVMPLAKRYGAAVVMLALDDAGIPKTVEGRLAIVQKLRAAAHSYGLRDEDLLVDVLTMTAATDEQAPRTTIDALKAVKALGLHCILGASNVSHGLPGRPALNAAFIRACVVAGADGLIANPNEEGMVELIHNTSAAPSSPDAPASPAEAQAWAAWQGAYQQALADAAAGLGALSSPAPAQEAEVDPQRALRDAILQGNVDSAPILSKKLVDKGWVPQDIIAQLLSPAIQDLGDAFARGEAFLPQLIASGDAMKAAVQLLKTYMPSSSEDRGRVLFCTVKGDIHSIGKDICVSLLESQGYRVFDLGVDVDPARIVAAAKEHQVQVACLSALMSTTLPAMREAAFALQRELPGLPILVGGAVVTEQWAGTIGVGYSSDAPDCVKKVNAAILASER